MTFVSLSVSDLHKMSLEELRSLADRVGIGYARLGEDQLRKKLKLEAIH